MTSETNGLLVKEDGSLHEVKLHTEADGSNLQAMKELLEVRMVDCIGLSEDLDCWVDDEGLLVAEPVFNPVLSTMLCLMGDAEYFICGSGLFLAVDPTTGETVSLNSHQRNMVETAHRMVMKATDNGRRNVRVVD